MLSGFTIVRFNSYMGCYRWHHICIFIPMQSDNCLFILQTRNDVEEQDSWVDGRAVVLLRRWVRNLRKALAFLGYFLARTSNHQQEELAPAMWRELHELLSEALSADNVLMRGFADDRGIPDYNIRNRTRPTVPGPPGDTPPECAICMDREPSVVLVPCGHTFCAPCLEGLGRCPSCRALFTEKYNMYF